VIACLRWREASCFKAGIDLLPSVPISMVLEMCKDSAPIRPTRNQRSRNPKDLMALANSGSERPVRAVPARPLRSNQIEPVFLVDLEI